MDGHEGEILRTIGTSERSLRSVKAFYLGTDDAWSEKKHEQR